ncbi:TPA: hypothetical protein IAA87_06145 [Candidatus Avigastranaerophilus faecigallinarum]|nr:hypothetical protein [Candidatus Avigastranaerophilus faecigallinarum]
MYIIEKIIKTYLKLTKKEKSFSYTTNSQNEELEDILTCKHNFMPIDSTGRILACSKCGYVVTRKRLDKNKNFFKNQ